MGGDLARMEEIKNMCKIWVEKLKTVDHLANLGDIQGY
jgi:hypothetical protein